MTDSWSTAGVKNIFGEQVKVVEMQSEGGADLGAVHGPLPAGADHHLHRFAGASSTIPNRCTRLQASCFPAVIHVSARAVASHALSIFGDHSDIYACRQTGYAMLCSTNPQEVMDLGAVAHLSAIKGRVPFLHFFDGFRTSHEIQKIEMWDYEDPRRAWWIWTLFRRSATEPSTLSSPYSTAQLRTRISSSRHVRLATPTTTHFPNIVEEYMNKVNAEIGTDYKLFNYYGAPDAEHVIVAMGSVCDTIEETIDYLLKQGRKGRSCKGQTVQTVRLLPHSLPLSLKQLRRSAVLDRTKEPGSLGEPLYLDVVAALKQENKFQDAQVFTGRYGLGSKDYNPGSDHRCLQQHQQKPVFTLGINDDVTQSVPRNHREPEHHSGRHNMLQVLGSWL